MRILRRKYERKIYRNNQEYVEQIFINARDIFCNGIYIKSDMHPCGWDFINFEDTDLETSEDVMDIPIEINAFSRGSYSYHDLEYKTLFEIIQEVGMSGWCFEISGTDNLN